MRGSIFVLLSAFLAAAAAPAAGAAQATSQRQTASPQLTYRGRVADQTRAPIAGARVTVVSDTKTTASIDTDQQGEFTLLLDPGSYAVQVAFDGFVAGVHRFRAAALETLSHEFVLEVSGVREEVTVTAQREYQAPATTTATKTSTALADIPQSIAVVTREVMADQLMTSMADALRYVPGVTTHQGENNRDQIIVRGNSSSADFFVDGVRDDVQYFRDLYNLDRVEALKGPNAMIFGRGGAGGVVNRVTKQALFMPIREVALQAGEYGQRRVAADLSQPLGGTVAFRLNGMYEDSGSFRNDVTLERAGVSPTITIRPSAATTIKVSYEYLRDHRVADRGIPSFQGRPAAVDIATYFGNPKDSRVAASVNLASAAIEHRAGAVLIRNHTLVGQYDRGYQNYVPGAVSADGLQVALTAYSNATNRTNVFNQTDVVYTRVAGGARHRILAGTEVGRQLTDNLRNTGFFGDTATSIVVPLASPAVDVPTTFRPNATDANNHVRAQVAAVYAQDQIEVTRRVQVVAGLRFDRFDLEYHNNRNGDELERVDLLISPRAGLVFKPVAPLSLYASYSVSQLPSSGDQFSSLTSVTQQMEPEAFRNYELGAKWDARRDLSVTTAVYRLNRTNTRAADPNDPTRILQTGAQQANGYELGVTGTIRPGWQVIGGYGYQDAFVRSATVSAPAGSTVGQVPRHTLSVWNKYQVRPGIAAALGVVHRTDMFAAIDDTVTLPRYTRLDAAAFVSILRSVRLQLNVENLANTRYFVNADSNTNISPGSPRALRIGLTTTF